MSEKTRKILLISHGVLTSLLLFVTGACFIAAACGINALGDDPYTYVSIKNAFSKIAPLVYVTLAAVLCGAVLTVITTKKNAKLKPERQIRAELSRLRLSRFAEDDSYEANAIKREQTKRRILFISNILLFVIGAALSLAYVLDGNNYSSDLNASVESTFFATVINLAPSMVFLVINLFIFDKSVCREIELLRQLPKEENDDAVRNAKKPKKTILSTKILGRMRVADFVQITLIAVSLLFIVLGIYNGGMDDVLKKAINICTECIGLG